MIAFITLSVTLCGRDKGIGASTSIQYRVSKRWEGTLPQQDWPIWHRGNTGAPSQHSTIQPGRSPTSVQLVVVYVIDNVKADICCSRYRFSHIGRPDRPVSLVMKRAPDWRYGSKPFMGFMMGTRHGGGQALRAWSRRWVDLACTPPCACSLASPPPCVRATLRIRRRFPAVSPNPYRALPEGGDTETPVLISLPCGNGVLGSNNKCN